MDGRRTLVWRAGLGLLAGIGLVATLVSIQPADDDRPRRSPAATTPPSPAAGAPVRVLALAATERALFRVVAGDCDACGRLETRVGTEDSWSPVGQVGGRVLHLTMSGSGDDGWAVTDDGLWSTHDGGRTWAAVTGGPRVGDQGVLATDSFAFAAVPGDNTRLWRSAVGADEWHRLPRPEGFLELATSRLVVAFTSGEGLSDPRLVGSTDGRTWSTLRLPCGGEPDVTGFRDTVFARCLPVGPDGRPGRQERVLRSQDFGPFQVFGDADLGNRQGLVALAPDRVLVGSGRRALLISGGPEGTPVDTRVRFVSAAASLGSTSLLQTFHGAPSESVDGGRTWVRLE